MVNLRRAGFARFFDEQTNRHALHDIEDVLIRAAVRRSFLLTGAAMQVEDVDCGEGLHQTLAHPPEGGVVQVAVVADVGQDAAAALLDTPLTEADELDVIVLQPFGVAFTQWLAVYFVVATHFGSVGQLAFEQPVNPRAFVGRMSGIGRVADDDHDGQVALDLIRRRTLVRQKLREQRQAGVFVRPFEGVGEVDADALVAAKVVGPGRALLRVEVQPGELQREFEVGDGVGRHQQLKAEDARQQVLAHVARPHPGVALRHKLRADVVNDGVGKSRRPGGGIEDENFVHFRRLAHLGVFAFDAQAGIGVLDGHFRRVGQALRQSEAGLEQQVHRADDEGDNGIGRVEDAALFTQGRIVSRQEGLVEVDGGVLLAGALAEVGEDRAHIGVGKKLHQVFDEAGERLVLEFRAGDLIEEIAQEGVGARDEVLRLGAGERAGRVVHHAGGEEAVGQGLGKHIGKLAGLFGPVKVGDQHFGEGFAPALQEIGGVPGLEGGNDDVADEVGQVRHPFGEFAGGDDRLRGVSQETVQEVADGLNIGGGGFELAIAVEGRQADRFTMHAVHVPAEFEVVGEDEVGQGVQVAFELRGTFHGVEVRADIFGFDVADEKTVLEDGEVGRTAGDAGGFVDGLDAGIGLEQDRQSGAVGVFGRRAGGEQLAQLGQVGGDGLGHTFVSSAFLLPSVRAASAPRR
ncbi:MAG: hypothetical protein BWY63_01651 [Chloroflexi bacterium ADurb.Bin360]|nr:MAG: hypothetical protein BWY63_01651 [Chloroflexi bacterium ADurb.Bin360]